MQEIELAKLCETETEHEALMVKAMLDEEGIKVMIKGLESSAFGDALDGADWIELFVPKQQLTDAKALVDDIQSEDEAPIPAWTCECGEDVDAGFFVCWSCQAEYKAE
jgi:hypothetical protein